MAPSPDHHSALNGAYYGPSIPPKDSSRSTFRRPGRGGGGPGSCICCCFECLGCCVFQLILQVILTVLFVLGLIAFLFWLIFRPNLVKFHVTSAELARFNVSSNNVLDYDLNLNVTVRNPNRRIGIYYDSIEVRTFYEGQRFDSQYLPPFYQGHKNTTYISGAFQGQQALVLDGGALKAYETDRADGVYGIDANVYLRVRFKLWWFKTLKFKPRVKCGLKVPLSTAAGAAAFETTKCDIGYWRIA
ncbi:hypothetical protein MLD38_020187 [Melastoma candidum]|uniref:Uncharacterized protein n=1 Tax=Melastoma candidum TaxID=119954 RepID=A0ACB9QDD5_9MYRT|nr:hypothetical protein MLD38_020187 [Melastoma candidum]